MDTSFPIRRDRGFTLIELMIAVVIVGILTAIAMPSYRNYVRRGAIEEATSNLGLGKVSLEQFYLDNRSFVGGPCPSATTNFSFSCTLAATSYTITATGSNLVSGFSYTLTNSDARTTVSPWGSGNCWIVREGDGC